MSNSDKEVLEEFETWRAELIGNGADLSVAAFLKERENDHNRLRIADALRVLNRVIPNERATDVTDYAMDAVEEARNILEGDRPWIENKKLTGETERVYV